MLNAAARRAPPASPSITFCPSKHPFLGYLSASGSSHSAYRFVLEFCSSKGQNLPPDELQLPSSLNVQVRSQAARWGCSVRGPIKRYYRYCLKWKWIERPLNSIAGGNTRCPPLRLPLIRIHWQEDKFCCPTLSQNNLSVLACSTVPVLDESSQDLDGWETMAARLQTLLSTVGRRMPRLRHKAFQRLAPLARLTSFLAL